MQFSNVFVIYDSTARGYLTAVAMDAQTEQALHDRGDWRGEIRDLLEGDSGDLYLVLDSQETLCSGPPWAPLWGRADTAEVQRRRRVLDGHPGAWVQVWGQGPGDA